MDVQMLPNGNRMIVIVRRLGKPEYRDRFDPVSARQRSRIAKAIGLSLETVDTLCEQVRIAGAAVDHTIPEEPAAGPGRMVIRPMESAARQSYSNVNDFLVAILSAPVDHVGEWEDREALSVLDIDYHGCTPPTEDWLATVVMTRLRPRPIAWHLSRGGGLHLFYLPSPPLSAEELAATAALRYRAIDGVAGLEIKRQIRGAGKATVARYPAQDSGTGFSEWLGTPEYDAADRAAWLETEGLDVGLRYSHEHCPINPSSSHGDPVVVGEHGIYCHKCSAESRSLGSRRAGFAPWSAILGAPSSGELGRLVRSLTHWGHAQWVLTETYGLPKALARLAYSAALKSYHDGRPSARLISRVFDPITDDYARVNNQWMSIPTLHAYPKGIEPILARMPAALSVIGDDIKADPAAVCDLAQFKDLSSRGYTNLELIHGVRLTESGRMSVVVPNPDLVRLDSRRTARYLPAARRMPEAAAWEAIDRIVPGVDRKLVKLFICAFACSQETRAGLLPILFVSGPTGAAKSATARIAAGIYGSKCAEAVFEQDPSRYRSSIREAAASSPVVLLNEMLKGGAQHRLTVRQTLDLVLTLTPDSMSHGMYRGPVRMGRLPAVVITEPHLPVVVRDETQLARRIRHYRVTGKKETWPATIQAAGVPACDLALLRGTSADIAHACDSLLSYIADEHLSSPTTWDALAESLGVRTLEKDENFQDYRPWLRYLFKLVCQEPDPPVSKEEKRLYARGYKRIARDEHSKELNLVYTMFADDEKWTSSRRLQEKDWSGILGVDDSVLLDMRTSGSNVFIRFRVGPDRRPRVNEEIADPSAWETPE